MKNFLKRFFGRRVPEAPPAKPQRPQAVVDIDNLRRLLRESATAAERAAHERALGAQLGQTGRMPAADDGPGVWLEAINTAHDKARVSAWLDHLTTELELEQVATSARLAEVRLQAAQRIADPERLARLAKQMRDRDRGVYRYCQGQLKQHVDQVRRASQIETLDRQLRQLMASRPIASGALYELRKHLAELGEGADLETCRALLKQANDLEQDDVAKVRELKALIAEARALGKTLTHPRAGSLAAESDRRRVQELEARLAAWPAAMTGQPEVTEFAALVAALQARLAALDEDARRADACRRFLAANAGQERTPERIAEWERLPKPENLTEREALLAAWAAPSGQVVAAEPPQAALPPVQPVKALADVEGFRQRLDHLAQALDAGASHQAFDLARELDRLTADATVPRDLGNRYRQLQGRLGQLRDWARWSGAQARDKLIEEAETLASGRMSLPHVAETVPKLRKEWQRLAGQSWPTQAQWERFDQALNQAYAPVLAERAERNARLAAIRDAKSALLDEAEQWLEGVAAPPANPGELQRQRHALRQHWRGLEQASPRDERSLHARFHRLMAALDERIEPCVQAELERRNRLLNAALRLQSEPGLRAAIQQARTLQSQWRDESSGVQLPRQSNEQQWQQFRNAIDGVFARREAERQDHATRRQAQTATRQALLTEFADCLQGQPGLARIEAALTHFEEQWDATTDGRTQRHRDELDPAAARLVRQAQDLIKDQRAARQQELFALMARKAAWAEAWEAATLADIADAAYIQRLQAEWQAAPSLPADLEPILAERFRQAAGMTAEAREAGHPRRNALLIDLELLLDLPSPPEHTQARQSRQLEWLQVGFQSLKDPAAILRRVADWYATPGSPDAGQAERICKVIEVLAQRLLA